MRETFRDRFSFYAELEHIVEDLFPKITPYEESRHVIKKWSGETGYLKISRPMIRKQGIDRRDNCLLVIIQTFAQFNFYARSCCFLCLHEDEVVLEAYYCHDDTCICRGITARFR